MSEYKRLTERAVKNLKGNNYPQDYYDIYNRLAELEDKIESGDLVFVPECEPKYRVHSVYRYKNDNIFLKRYCVQIGCCEPTFEPFWVAIEYFGTEEEAEKYLEELQKNG